MNIQDVERLYSGIQEIDRKKNLIELTMKILIRILNSHFDEFIKVRRCKVPAGCFSYCDSDEIIASKVIAKDVVFEVEATKNNEIKFYLKQGRCLMIIGDRGNHMALGDIPSIYDHLPAMMSFLLNEFSELKIEESIDFYKEQAPD
ncbi:hypothetical protein ACFL08_01765 [Patescibacteria group bacterium]